MKSGMRITMVVAVTCAIGCATAPPPRVVLADADVDVATLIERYPLASGANLRNDEILRSPSATLHLVQVRGGESPHRHLAHDLFVTVLRGEGVLHVGSTERTVHAGDVSVIPRGVAHWFRNSGRSPAVTIAVFAPPLDAPDSVPVSGD
jgi:quercetin dioxygenase-like cupin family protein